MRALQVSNSSWKGLISCLIMILLMGCSTHVGNPEEEGSSSKPAKNKQRDPDEKVIFALTHSTYDAASSIMLYIESLAIKSSDAKGNEDEDNDNWITIPLDSPEPIDLLSFSAGYFYNFAGSKDIPPGHYSELRLILNADQAASLTLQDGSIHALKVPSGNESGIKIKGDIIIDGKPDNLYIMEFDLNRSIIPLGPQNRANPGQGKDPGNSPGNGPGKAPIADSNNPKFLLKPVLRLVKEDQSGEVSGDNNWGNIVCVYENIVDADTDPSCAGAIATAPIKNGKYHLPFLPQGVYDLRIFDESGEYEDLLAVKVDRRPVRVSP